MQYPASAFGSSTTASGGVSADRIKLSTSSCTLSGWRIYSPYLLNNLMNYQTTSGSTTTGYDPKSADKFKTLLSTVNTASNLGSSSVGTITNVANAANYNSVTMAMVTACAFCPRTEITLGIQN